MNIKDLSHSKVFVAGDGTVICELLNPNQEDLKLRYSIAHAQLEPGKTSLPHKLKSSEVYYILEGEGSIHINEEFEKVREGQVIYIPPSSIQYIQNTGKNDLKFLCVVDPAWRAEDEEIF
jgi:mannose-6-phosphate isomerase-like protein (cupin superfamily)